ncbi:MAG: hypothetical protein IKP65_04920 [Alphaproteobacteria bacterium]|nr:hypothetical protein [Alphaproteobacteria bacterium]
MDVYGNTKYELIDSSKLSLLCILKGSYRDSANNPFTLLESKLNGDLTASDSGFILPPITTCQRICLIPFTDYGDSDDTTASGFKLKAGPKHFIEYNNYDFINNTG